MTDEIEIPEGFTRWIAWDGRGPIPDGISGLMVEVCYRSGIACKGGAEADFFDWDHCGDEGDIIAYRIVS